jgi:hypothetical protein
MVCVWVCVHVRMPEFHLLNYLTVFYGTSYISYHTQGHLNSVLLKFVVSNNSMTDMQTCEVNGTLASLI